VSRYQKGKTSLDFTGARDSEWQWQYASLHLAPDTYITAPAPHHYAVTYCVVVGCWCGYVCVWSEVPVSKKTVIKAPQLLTTTMFSGLGLNSRGTTLRKSTSIFNLGSLIQS